MAQLLGVTGPVGLFVRDPPPYSPPRMTTMPGTGGPYTLENVGGNYTLTRGGKEIFVGSDLEDGLKGLGLSKDLMQRLLEVGPELKDGQKLVVKFKQLSS